MQGTSIAITYFLVLYFSLYFNEMPQKFLSSWGRGGVGGCEAALTSLSLKLSDGIYICIDKYRLGQGI
jgi:hypothetical protein